jgi:hypothetical protein
MRNPLPVQALEVPPIVRENDPPEDASAGQNARVGRPSTSILLYRQHVVPKPAQLLDHVV